jgi:hypothetical protein
VQQMGDSGPQLIGSGSDTMLEMGLEPYSTQKASSKVKVYPQPYKWPISLILKQCGTSNMDEVDNDVEEVGEGKMGFWVELIKFWMVSDHSLLVLVITETASPSSPFSSLSSTNCFSNSCSR